MGTNITPAAAPDNQSIFNFWDHQHGPSVMKDSAAAIDSPSISPGAKTTRSVRKAIAQRPPSSESVLSASDSDYDGPKTKIDGPHQMMGLHFPRRPEYRRQYSQSPLWSRIEKRTRSSSITSYVGTNLHRPGLSPHSHTSRDKSSYHPSRSISTRSRSHSQDSWRSRTKVQRVRYYRPTLEKRPIKNTVTGLMTPDQKRHLVKLRPPVSREASPPPQHIVNIETEFTRVEEAAAQVKNPISLSRSASRRSKHFYAKSKRLVRHKYGRLHRPSQSLDSLPSKNRTAEALGQVTNMLFRIIDELSPTPRKVLKVEANTRQIEIPLQRPRSNISYTSSIRELRRGVNPDTSPNPDATYRARLRPDGPSEEFLKVDLLEPGGTSYLSSEARRIHTPPLPGEGPNRMKRPFFFDYNSPPANDDIIPSFLRNNSDPHSKTAGPRPGLIRSSSSASSHPSTIGRRYSPNDTVSHRCKRTGEGEVDWYDAQLMELERVEQEAEMARVTRIAHSRAALASSVSESSDWDGTDGERAVMEADVDCRIPDHYPSSPLCPRHLKHKSKGRGVCWMHGRNPSGFGPMF